MPGSGSGEMVTQAPDNMTEEEFEEEFGEVNLDCEEEEKHKVRMAFSI